MAARARVRRGSSQPEPEPPGHHADETATTARPLKRAVRPVKRAVINVLGAIAVIGVLAAVVVAVVRVPDGDRRATPVTSPASKPGASDGPPLVAGAPRGMHLVFRAEFRGAPLDRATWSTCYPWADEAAGCTNFGNAEIQWYLPSQVEVGDDALHLVASRTPTPGMTREGEPEIYPWRSGMVTTYRSFQFTYGFIEVEARVPKGDGLWTALWLLPHDQSFPPEIDIAEVYGNDTSQLSVTYHAEPRGRAFTSVETGDLSDAYHRYAVQWEPESITWYLDGRPVYEYRGPTPSQPMYFLANLAVAYFFGGGPSDATPPSASLRIRSVSVYQR